jgi:hypothetical protein
MKLNLVFVLFIILLAVSIVPVYASVSVTSTIGDSIYVVYDIQNLNSTVYDAVKNNQQFNMSTIPTTIVKNLENQGQTQVSWGFGPQTDIFNDATRAIQVSFYLWGSDIISSTINQTTMKRTYQVKTDWRKFQLDLTSSFSLNFTQILAKSVAEWQKTNEHTFLYEGQDTSFKFILPQTATQVQAQGDTITFEGGSLSFWDVFLNSPFLILAVLIIIIIIALVYRKAR